MTMRIEEAEAEESDDSPAAVVEEEAKLPHDSAKRGKKWNPAEPVDEEGVVQIRKVVDKMLMNYRLIGLIHLVFPKAVILNTVRDPMDTLFSCYKNKFSDEGTAWTHNISHLVKEYALYLELMQHYRSQLPVGTVVDVSYEALVAAPETVMKDLVVRVLGLPWEPQVLQYYNFNRTVHTASVLQVQQGVYTDSVGGWRKYKEQLQELAAEFQRYLPRLRSLGALPTVPSIPLYPGIDSANAGIDSANAAAKSAIRGHNEKQQRSRSPYEFKSNLKSNTEAASSEEKIYMNWDADPQFNYTAFLQSITSSMLTMNATSRHDQQRGAAINENEKNAEMRMSYSHETGKTER
jgi:hypothetical protein